MKSYKRVAEDKQQLQQFADEATAAIEELKTKKPFYQSEFDADGFGAVEFDALITGEYAGIRTGDGAIYHLYGLWINEDGKGLDFVYISDDQYMYKLSAYNGGEGWQKSISSMAIADESNIISPLYHSRNLNGNFDKFDMRELATGKYAGIRSSDGYVYSCSVSQEDHVLCTRIVEADERRLCIIDAAYDSGEDSWIINEDDMIIPENFSSIFEIGRSIKNLTNAEINTILELKCVAVHDTYNDALFYLVEFVGNDSLVFRQMYNTYFVDYKFEYQDDEWVYASETQISLSTTRLYKHSIYFNFANVVRDPLIDDPALNILIINNRATKYTLAGLAATTCQVGFDGVIAITCEGGASFMTLEYDKANNKINANGGFANSSVHYETIIDFSDTVTPL